MTWEKNVKIKIFAVVARGDDEEKENIRIVSDGVMTFDGTRLEIRYDEIMGDDGPATNTLSFDESERGVVTLIREGAVSAVMTFSDGGRFGGVYRAGGIASFEFTVATRRVVNDLSFEKGGTLLLDYNTEIQGVAVQTSRFSFEITCEGGAREKIRKNRKNFAKTS